MKKHHSQPLLQLKTLIDTSDDEDMNITSTSAASDDTDQSSKITSLMRENERKIRTLSESYMNRFLLIGQQLQSMPPVNQPTPMHSIVAPVEQRMPLTMIPQPQPPPPPATLPPSLTTFIESLKQLLVKEERKREKCYLPTYEENPTIDPYTRLSNGISQCLRDYEAEINHAKRRVTDLNEQQEHMLNENKHVMAQLTEAFEQNTVSLRQTYEKQLAKQREESIQIGQSLDKYKVEILTLRDSYEKKLRAKDVSLNELNDRLLKSEAEQAARQHALHLKVEQFQQSFETLQARNKQVEQNHQIKAKENRDLLAQISTLQIQIQRLQQTITTKANECSDLSQKLANLLPRVAECERYESELRQWFALISPENSATDLPVDTMATMVASKISHFDSYKRQLDALHDELDAAQILDGHHLSDRVRHLLAHHKQMETAYSDTSNKYQALLLQVNMLTGIIKQHSTEVANHKTNEEQLKDFNEQLLNENQKIKMEIQDYRAKLLQISNANSQLEHECNLNKQHTRDVQVQYDTFRTENQMLTNELQSKREAIKRYEQELQSMKQLFDMSLKEKQLQSDRLQHERQLFQTENDSLKQLMIRDGFDKQPAPLNPLPLLSRISAEKELIGGELFHYSNGSSRHQDNHFTPLANLHADEDNADDLLSRRATSTPTFADNEVLPPPAHVQSLPITKQINQVLNDMKSLLTYSREAITKHDDIVPERDFKVRKRNKSRPVRKERATVIGIEQH